LPSGSVGSVAATRDAIDESRAGYGLGLAIAGDIVAQYGGTLRLGRSEDLDGFLAEAVLPCPSVGNA
jgi:signal transduction histidine kinase